MYSKDKIRDLLKMPLSELIALALEAKLRDRGDSFSLCTIMNVKSGRCSEDCAFCAQSSRYRTGCPVFSIKSTDEILKAATRARDAGAARFSLVSSGRGLSMSEVDELALRIEQIRSCVGISVCGSFGILDSTALGTLKSAGLSRYHHNIETSETFFPKVISTHSFKDRISTIQKAKDMGLDVCAGGIIGIGESAEDRVSMALTLSSLEVDSIPLNILIPIKGTPLASQAPMAVEEILRSIAIFRLIFPDKAIRIAGGRESALMDFQGLAFWAGADAMLIGGYLTVSGRPVDHDLRLVREVKRLWQGCSSEENA
ncbi:MAG: biotin synthase [delta proteobacterium ML8_D]|jgi:biotin synthase|nr:MAG: biotin synthase [delta proteobacterium ML8_D]